MGAASVLVRYRLFRDLFFYACKKRFDFSVKPCCGCRFRQFMHEIVDYRHSRVPYHHKEVTKYIRIIVPYEHRGAIRYANFGRMSGKTVVCVWIYPGVYQRKVDAVHYRKHYHHNKPHFPRFARRTLNVVELQIQYSHDYIQRVRQKRSPNIVFVKIINVALRYRRKKGVNRSGRNEIQYILVKKGFFLLFK